MIGTIVKIGWIQLRRDRMGQATTFLLPIVFFTVSVGLFGGAGTGQGLRVKAAVVDEHPAACSRLIVAALQREPSLEVLTGTRDAEQARALVRQGRVPAAIVLPAGLEASCAGAAGQTATILVLADAANPIARHLVRGVLHKALAQAAPWLPIQTEIEQIAEQTGRGLTGEQRSTLAHWLEQLRAETLGTAEPGMPASPASAGQAADRLGPIGIAVEDVSGERQGGSVVAFYAAGVAVMFLLFMSARAGGSLLEEEESGTLERLLGTELGMGRLLLGKGLFATTLGAVQVTVMFLWGALLFGVDLFGRLPGFAVLTLATSAAGAGFGLMLATLCRTRSQLAGVSTIGILIMSAIGGSMFPRFLMSEGLQKAGLITFNAWALDGYVKLFWRDATVLELGPQLVVLVAQAAIFLALARVLARRWETR